MTYQIGQVLTGKQPEYREAAEWCNANGAKIEAQEDGAYKIVAVTPPEPTYAELRAPLYPTLTELADAMYWASKGDNTKLTAYYAACEAVKTAIPKE